jgi:hypothetical protein
VLLSTANAQTRSSTPIRYAARIDAYGRGLRLGVPVDEFEVPVAIFEEPDSRSQRGHRNRQLLHGDDRSRHA